MFKENDYGYTKCPVYGRNSIELIKKKSGNLRFVPQTRVFKMSEA